MRWGQVLGGLVAFAVAFPASSSASPPAGLAAQTIPEYGFSIDVPSSWFPESPLSSVVK